MNTYLITTRRTGHDERTHLKEATDIMAAFRWAQARWSEGDVGICVRLAPLRQQRQPDQQEARHA